MSFSVISTFSGCGGSSLGYKKAGGRVLLAIEWDDDAVETYKLNFPDTPIFHGDIAKLTSAEIFKRTGLVAGELDIFDGSPPCQGFSTTGKREFSDSRNQLFKEYCRILRALQPKCFVMENVSGMVKGQMKILFAEILRELSSCGYEVKAALLNAMHYGVPQSRERMIFIGVRRDLKIAPSHPRGDCRTITVRSALEGCPDIEDRPMAEWMRKALTFIRPGTFGGDSISKAFIATKGTSGSAISTKVLGWDRPSCTITKSEIAASGLVHPNRKRYLNIHELKRLGSFPDDFIFTDRKHACLRIGNSVPPLLMKAIAQHIKINVLDKINKPFIKSEL